ncbi:hypothetical protein HGRIS_002960 [Hohenbuehelia grisea]|uniref:F-box domain-containing protein n=1 Tax=Hohenbuehelia grisea TaxID=104357 RepID=A0ABR3JNE7_9AGAR
MPTVLPLELIDHIVDQQSDDLEFLRTCALISSDWLYSARCHLFDRLRIRLHNDERGTRRCESALQLLTASPHLAGFFRHVDVAFVPAGWDGDNAAVNEPSLPQIFERLTHVRVLKFATSSMGGGRRWNTLPPGLVKSLHVLAARSTLRHLCLSNWRFNLNSDLAHLLDSCAASLRSLHLERIVQPSAPSPFRASKTHDGVAFVSMSNLAPPPRAALLARTNALAAVSVSGCAGLHRLCQLAAHNIRRVEWTGDATKIDDINAFLKMQGNDPHNVEIDIETRCLVRMAPADASSFLASVDFNNCSSLRNLSLKYSGHWVPITQLLGWVVQSIKSINPTHSLLERLEIDVAFAYACELSVWEGFVTGHLQQLDAALADIHRSAPLQSVALTLRPMSKAFSGEAGETMKEALVGVVRKRMQYMHGYHLLHIGVQC